jgi:1,4-alpha-glucan branching enzyme
LNKLYRAERALHVSDMEPEGFRWISCDDSTNSVYSYIRQSNDRNDFLVIVVNFTPVPRHDYKIGVPVAGFYSELMNTDAGYYGGSSVGNAGGVYSMPGPCHGQNQHVSLTLPPLGMLVLKPITALPAASH